MRLNSLKKSVIMISELLSPVELKGGFKIIVFAFFIAIMEVVGAASIMPFLAVLMNPEVIDGNLILEFLSDVANYFDVHQGKDFRFSGLYHRNHCFVIIALSNAVYNENDTYVEELRFSLSNKLVKTNVNRSYLFFCYETGRPYKVILSEVDQLIELLSL